MAGAAVPVTVSTAISEPSRFGPPAQTAAHIVVVPSQAIAGTPPSGIRAVTRRGSAGAVLWPPPVLPAGTTATVCPPFSTCRPDWLPHPAASTASSEIAASPLMPAAPAARW